MNSSFTLESAPHDLGVTATGRIMKILILTLIPALLVNIYFYGFGVLINVLLSLVACLVTEGVMLRLRKRHLNLLWRDNSAAVTAVILGLTLPQILPWHQAGHDGNADILEGFLHFTYPSFLGLRIQSCTRHQSVDDVVGHLVFLQGGPNTQGDA